MKPTIITVLTLAFAVLFGSCNDQSDSPIYGNWMLEKYNCIATSSYGLTQVDKNENYVLQLDNTGVFCFATDCNTKSGNYEMGKTTLNFSNVSFTEKACEYMLVKESIKSNLPSIKSYEIKDDLSLILKDEDGHILIELIKL